ncbi:MAG: RHS repeat-associated core domain-containing protein [Acidobacteria bacterium]|nr:RHS repeat-associated core domain-containing protein [Acidobacteriota bacterium]
MTTDHLGSPRLITNQNGAVTKRQDFGAFGDERLTAARASGLGYTTTDELRQDYTGYQKDNESGLEYAQARYYNTAHGRFTSVDPLTASATIRDPQSFTRYSYVLNSPYKFTDPLGLLPLTSAGACGQWCQNSGSYVDGSAFRGRDTTFEHLKTASQLNREWWVRIEAATAGISDDMVMAGMLLGRTPASGSPVLRVLIRDPKTLLTAEQMTAMQDEISRIFGEAGFGVIFTDHDFVYNLEIAEQNPDPDVVGQTEMESQNGPVRPLGTVFVKNLITNASSDALSKALFEQNPRNLGIGLGRAAAHEIGHFLLQQTYDSSSIRGVMHKSFNGRQWFSSDTRSLWTFNSNQIHTIRNLIQPPNQPDPNTLCVPDF